jgi:hypothetical protein
VNLLYLPIFLMLILLKMSPHTTGEDTSRSFLFETYSAVATFQAAASQLLSPCDIIMKAFHYNEDCFSLALWL